MAGCVFSLHHCVPVCGSHGMSHHHIQRTTSMLSKSTILSIWKSIHTWCIKNPVLCICMYMYFSRLWNVLNIYHYLLNTSWCVFWHVLVCIDNVLSMRLVGMLHWHVSNNYRFNYRHECIQQYLPIQTLVHSKKFTYMVQCYKFIHWYSPTCTNTRQYSPLPHLGLQLRPNPVRS